MDEKLFEDYILHYEEHYPEKVNSDTIQLERSGDKITAFITILEESLKAHDRDRTMWVIFRYGSKDKFNLLLEAINNNLTTEQSIEKFDNLAQSQETLLHFLQEKELFTEKDFKSLIIKLQRRESKGMSDIPRKLIEQITFKPITIKIENKLTIEQIALKLYYEGVTVNRINCNDIIQKYHHKSGEKLFQRYTYYASSTNRTGALETKKKMKNKIELFSIVVDNLAEHHKKKAKDDLTMLRLKYEKKDF